MKYIIIPYIALGLVLAAVIGIEYNCTGQEKFPTFYGSPFVFKQTSLVSSMEYYYSISGLLTNVIIWSIMLYLINIFINRLIKRFKNNRFINMSYKAVIGIMMLFTTLNVFMDIAMIGYGFNKGVNYWYWNINKEANDWGMSCKGELILFEK